jgi:hypothetical protein
VEHPGELDVVDVVAAPTEEALVLLALDGVAEALDRFGCSHHALLILAAAFCTAFTMFW